MVGPHSKEYSNSGVAVVSLKLITLCLRGTRCSCNLCRDRLAQESRDKDRLTEKLRIHDGNLLKHRLKEVIIELQ